MVQTGHGSGAIRYRAPDNYGGTARTGLVMVRWPTPTEGQNVQVTQSGCLYATAGATAFGSAGGSGSLSIYSTPEPYCGGPFGDACVWTARSDVAWITITTSMPRNGDDVCSFTVVTNDSAQARSGTITIASQGRGHHAGGAVTLGFASPPMTRAGVGAANSESASAATSRRQASSAMSSIPSFLPRLREYLLSFALFQCSCTPRLASGLPVPFGSYTVPDGGFAACAASCR